MKTTTIFLLALLLACAAQAAEKQSAEELYKQGKAHYDKDEFDQALKLFDQVVSNYPKDPLATYAAHLSLDILNLRKDYDGLAKLARRYYENKILEQEGCPTIPISKLLSQAMYKQAEEKFKAEKYPQAAQDFIKIADEFPKSSVADGALYNAAISYEKANNNAEAHKIYQRLIGDYPKSPLAKRAAAAIKKATKEK
jgi:TolA-binding protein